MKIFLLLLIFLFTCTSSWAQSLSALAPRPNWSQLEKYQDTITREEFVNLLDHLYTTNSSWKKWITITPDHAQIVTQLGSAPFILHFAAAGQKKKLASRTWKSRAQLPPLNASKPLAGLRITLDPGHLGGKWAIMEERCFRVKDSMPIKEGDMTLKVAHILAPRLRALGAHVTFTRSRTAPTTSSRPKNFRSLAISELRKKKMPTTAYAIKKKSEELFYRTAEIRNRARLINEKLHPDIVLCLHFNAEDWGKNFQTSTKDHLHFLVAGGLSEEEFAKEDQRVDILLKLLSRTSTEEIRLAQTLAKTFVRHTQLPPYSYKTNNAISMSSYVWARNLLATRLFQCPVVFIESYVMNNSKFISRIEAGNYLGTKYFPGIGSKKSIYREYADSIVDGLVQYYSSR